MDALMLDFRTAAKAQVLKYAAGKQCFCPNPKCKHILDWHKTVTFTASHINHPNTVEVVMCLDCYKEEKFQKTLKVQRTKGFRFSNFYRLRVSSTSRN